MSHKLLLSVPYPENVGSHPGVTIPFYQKGAIFLEASGLTSRSLCCFFPVLWNKPMLRQVLKSKIHRATVTDANVDYEGSISIAEEFMQTVDLWEGEKVLVASITSGARLETYVQKSPAGSAEIVINGGAAHRIKQGERITIMAYAVSETPVESKRILLNEKNEIVG